MALLGTAHARAQDPGESSVEPGPQPIAVTVRGESDAQRVSESAQAVRVVDTREAKLHSGDTGELLARTEGVAVQRSGGMGSQTRISLHGLVNDQVRVFLDGVPLELAGFGLGLATVPLNWLERIEVHRGVVPPRYGADALGGAIDLVSDQRDRKPSASASYSTGAFDTHGLTLSARTLHAPSGFVARGAGFFDTTRNDYTVRARIARDDGSSRDVTVRRFHDGYRGGGGSLEAGFVDRPWAKRLLLRAFATRFSKELQHNLYMTVPYGGVTYGQDARGGTLRYELPRIAGSHFGVAVLAGYSHRTLHFRDVSRTVYDWFGQPTFERPEGAGELNGFASDLTQWEDRVIGRASATYNIAPGHVLRLVVAPDFAERAGHERLRVDRDRMDPLSTQREIFQLVSAIEYAAHTLDDRLENSAFAKHYLYAPSTDQVETFDNSRRALDELWQRFGAGDALRVRITPGLLGKVSYEYATRLPRSDEVFGDGGVITPNMRLTPESSHNANVGAQLRQELGEPIGRVSLEASGFLRRTSDMIVPLTTKDRTHITYHNVVDVATLGVDGMLHWSSPARWFSSDVNGTWLDLRNDSTSGPFVSFRGRRLPNRPWLFANVSARARIPGVGSPNAALTLIWNTRYVHAFEPGWEGTGAPSDTGRVPTQLVHGISVMYSMSGSTSLDFTFDLTNLTDARVYDTLGVQKAGRAAYFKVTGCWACQQSNR